MAESGHGGAGTVLLCADDYAMTDGVSRGIEDLARAGRISATSAFVTTAHWRTHATRAADLRGQIAVGLHFNLTLGAPLAPMPTLAPGGRLPGIGRLTGMAIRRAIDPDEIAAEATRQIAAFERGTGFPPDFIDGHQHVHALPGVRNGLLTALAARGIAPRPLLRDPTSPLAVLARRGTAMLKAAALSWLGGGFGNAARRAGFPVNDSFAGVTDFQPGATAADFRRAMIGAGTLHLVMCHPGYPDAELASIDPVTERRRAELDVLASQDVGGPRLWRPQRTASGSPVDWTDLVEPPR